MQLPPFNITSGRYYKLLVQMYLHRVWWLYALPAVALVALCIALTDIRYLFLLLIYAFVVFPMAFTFALISYGLHPTNRYSILKKSAEVGSEGITFSFIDEEGNIKSTVSISWNEVTDTIPTRLELLLVLSSRHFRFIAIPYSTFQSPEILKEFLIITKNKGKSVK